MELKSAHFKVATVEKPFLRACGSRDSGLTKTTSAEPTIPQIPWPLESHLGGRCWGASGLWLRGTCTASRQQLGEAEPAWLPSPVKCFPGGWKSAEQAPQVPLGRGQVPFAPWQLPGNDATRPPTLQAPGMALCSPAGNGYGSARASPNLLPVSNGSSLGKAVPAKSPPPPPQHSNPLVSNLRKPDLRVITSQGGKGLMQHLNTQRLVVSQATHSLTTPVVSVATPSLLTQGLPFSAMPTAYNTDYQLSSAELSSLPAFSSPTNLSLGSLSAWQPHHLPHAATAASLSAATLTVNTSPSISIKSEPVSPSRERSSGTPLSSFPHQARHEPSGRSPVDSLSSNASSYEGPPEREDPSRPDFGSSLGLLRPSTEAEGENASTKRMRLDAWAT
uniref:Myocyte-specific enhancer factor 2D n=1 Tax=Laticauda laticaudata TaxID=8630 RepID=A0A8C5S0E1_LATLA